MRRATGSISLALATMLLAAACGGTEEAATTPTAAPPPTDATTTTAAPTTTTAAPTTTAAATTTTTTTTTTEAAGMAIEVDGDQVTIDWSQVASPFFAAPVAGAADPFYQLHTDPDSDGFFLGIEAYTVYGAAWTGELGTFEIDCTPQGTGICVHFDPDGSGPEPNAGADFAATGTITFLELEDDSFSATLENVQFSNGLTIAGPLAVTG